ncbi:hypothetical protein Tco_0753320 [Tanacetum coccineum]
MVTKNKLGKGNKRLKGRDWTGMDVEKLNEMVNKIDKTLKIREHLKRLEEYVAKRKRRTELVQEVFVKEDIVVDRMHMNLTLPQGITGGSAGQVFKEPRVEILITTLASNLRRIQVKDVIKEVKDYLKPYSSTGMDISYWQNCSQKYGQDVSKNGRALIADVLQTQDS